MSATVIRGSLLLTPDGLKRNWGVRVESGTITQVSPNEDLRIEPLDQVYNKEDQLILPGFVNGHTHMYGVLSHGISTNTLVTNFSNFLEDFWWPYIEDRLDHALVAATTKWACVEMIESGVTSFFDILEGPNSIPGALEVERAIIEEVGLRARLSFEALERVSNNNGELGLQENIEFIRNHNSTDGLVQGVMSIHTLFTCSKEFVQRAKDLAQKEGAFIHMHLSESSFEPDWCNKMYGTTPVALYEELDFLDHQVIASQGVQLSTEELRTLKKCDTSLISMPLSNCEVGGGFAPLPDMVELGMRVGLGSDGYVNNFFEVMRGAFLMHKGSKRDPQVMPAKQVYEMATSQGAIAAGIPKAGSLKEGYYADLITLDLNFPTPVHEHNVYDQIVLFANPEKVRNVMVHGRWLKEDGELCTIDKQLCRQEMHRQAGLFWKTLT